MRLQPATDGSERGERDGKARQQRRRIPRARSGAYRAGVGVEAGLRALGVGHGARGEDERPPPRRGRRDGRPAAAPAVARLRAEAADRGVAGGGRGWRGAVVARGDHGHGRRGGHGGHRHCSCSEEGRGRQAPSGGAHGVPVAWRRIGE